MVPLAPVAVVIVLKFKFQGFETYVELEKVLVLARVNRPVVQVMVGQSRARNVTVPVVVREKIPAADMA